MNKLVVDIGNKVDKGNEAELGQVQASTGKEQFRWHHDMEDKRLKLMTLLSDIGESDQYMSYLIGSHVLLHPLPSTLN